MNAYHTIDTGPSDRARAGSPAGHVLVVGLGATGLSCVRHLARPGRPDGPDGASDPGRRIVAVDSRRHPPCRAEVESEFPEVEIRCGDFEAPAFDTAAEIVVSPGVSVREPALQSAAAHGVPIVGDIELFARAADAPVVAITGSNGKSTVTSLVAAMARSDGVRVGSGGNLGPPALTLLGRGHELYVLELSSFQLETTGALRPVAATVLNVSADHMDRYENLDAYVAAKSRALEGDTVVITNLDDPLAAQLGGDRCRRIGFSVSHRPGAHWYVEGHGDTARIVRHGEPVMLVGAVPLAGMHNVANVLAAFALGDAIGLRVRAMVGAVEGFTGLPHRCETVAVHRGIRWINDSKGTNVGAAVAAIEGIGAQGPVVLIAGGIGKGADFAPLGEPAGRYVRCAVLIGRDAPGLAAALGGSTEVRHAKDLPDAVDIAAAVASAGDSVLFSPACASFDMFADFEARGDAFRRLVPGRSAR
ncbi:MAG: UDP-N-acetylmuramoyl-L-alanine--D-glutamate ligase [Thiotrichales bacterium]|nr:UDP-N-acetylmuramoyl-L-alanine--D-glutamate ligase [Thiotrichales bacterium]